MSTILLIDVTSVVKKNVHEMDAIIRYQRWSHIYLLLTPSGPNKNYTCPELTVSATMLSHVPAFRTIYAPSKIRSRALCYASGFMNGLHPQADVMLYSYASPKEMQCLLESVEVSFTVIDKTFTDPIQPSQEEEDAEEEDDTDEDEEDVEQPVGRHNGADSEFMSTAMQFMGTDAGQTFIKQVMSDMQKKA